MQVFSDSIENHNSIVERIPYNSQDSRNDGQRNFAAGKRKYAESNQHIVYKRCYCANCKLKLKPPANV